VGNITIRITIAAVILAGIGGYAFYESRNLINGPVVTIETPSNGQVSRTAVTDISGLTKNTVRISMNDREISVDPTGRFEEKFVLSNGNNRVKISAEDRFGRKTESFVEILYTKPGEPFVQRDTSQPYQ
jgi:hypothetical protein